MKTLSLYITTVANMRGLLHWYQFVSIILFLIFYLGFVALYNRLKKINRDSWIDSILHFYLAIIEHEVWLFLPIWWYRYVKYHNIEREREFNNAISEKNIILLSTSLSMQHIQKQTCTATRVKKWSSVALFIF